MLLQNLGQSPFLNAKKQFSSGFIGIPALWHKHSIRGGASGLNCIDTKSDITSGSIFALIVGAHFPQ